MVKYRLIREYPGSPKVGTVVVDTNINNGAKDAYFSENWGKPNSGSAFFIGKNHDCENQPEFWEKVEEIEYEILSFKGTLPSNSDGLFIRKNDKFYYKLADCDWLKDGDLGISEKGMFGNTTIIHSIKRLSDGEIFTVGDKLVVNGYMAGRKYITIDSIYYNEHDQLSFSTNTKPAPCTFVFGVSDINCKRYKEPLFITDDGKEIFEGDRVFLIKQYQNTSIAWLVVIPSWSSKFGDKGRAIDTDLAFHSEELARKWIDENKPKYSKKDILNTIEEVFESSIKELEIYVGKKLEHQIQFEGYYLSKLRDKIYYDKT